MMMDFLTLARVLPNDLRLIERFLLWRAVQQRNGKTKKVPYYANGRVRNGSLDTPEDLAQLVTFDEAAEAFRRGEYDGIGFALTGDGIGAFDMDHCLDERGKLIKDHPGFELIMIAQEAGAYVEISPSGTGVRIVGPCQNQEAYSKGGVEYWGEKHFVTLTGRVRANAGGWVALDDLRSRLGTRTSAVGERDEADQGIITPRTIDELKSALESIPSGERELWVRIGHALKTLPDDRGQPLWLEWSQKSDKYDEADALAKWDSFNPTQTDFRAVFAEAQRDWGWENPRAGKRRSAKDAFGEEENEERAEGQAGSSDDWKQIDLPDVPTFDPTEFVLDGFMPTGVSVIAGAWGAGKTTNLIPLMASVAHLSPREWGFWPDLRRHIIWVTEAPGQALDTLLSLQKAEGSADWSEFKEWFHLFAARRQSAKRIAKGVKGLVDQLRWATGTGFRVKPVIILDTTTANIELENENDNSQVGEVMSKLKQSLPGVSFVLIGHTPKALLRTDIDGLTFRGAGAWEAEAAATFFLVYDPETNMRFLAIRKARFAPTYREINFGTEDGSTIIDTPWGEPQTKAFLHGVPSKSDGEARKAAQREAKEARREETRAQVQRDLQQRHLAAIHQLVGEAQELATRASTHHIVGGDKALSYGAMNALIEAGLVQEHSITKEQFEALGRKLNSRLPKVILPIEVEFEAYYDRLRENLR